MMEGDRDLSNPIYAQTLETRALRRCPDSPSRNVEDHGKNAGSISHINHALHILGVMTPSPAYALCGKSGLKRESVRHNTISRLKWKGLRI